MKPSWDDAPEWAQWLAMDDDGVWFWYEDRPYLPSIHYHEWVNSTHRKSARATEVDFDFRDSLECRP